MPELPEVQTTVNGLNETVIGLKIESIWTDYGSDAYTNKDEIKNASYFGFFKKMVIGHTIKKAERIGKNILIRLNDNSTILIHMKMTGHLLYGSYAQKPKTHVWVSNDEGPLRDDPFNRHIHLVFSLSNGKHLVLSDMRTFAKVTFIPKGETVSSKHLTHIAIDPLSPLFVFDLFSHILDTKPEGKIKQTLLDQSLISGIGNIYADEALFRSEIHPCAISKNINTQARSTLLNNIKRVLMGGVDLGDETSDYRDIYGQKASFKENHLIYRKKGQPCTKPHCTGIIETLVVGGRTSSFCPIHQKQIFQ
jgi:formamidopyrimidine-DNA glycosylase